MQRLLDYKQLQVQESMLLVIAVRFQQKTECRGRKEEAWEFIKEKKKFRGRKRLFFLFFLKFFVYEFPPLSNRSLKEIANILCIF